HRNQNVYSVSERGRSLRRAPLHLRPTKTSTPETVSQARRDGTQRVQERSPLHRDRGVARCSRRGDVLHDLHAPASRPPRRCGTSRGSSEDVYRSGSRWWGWALVHRPRLDHPMRRRRSMRFDWSEYEAVLFDLDGVLTSTAALHAAAWKRTFDAV